MNESVAIAKVADMKKESLRVKSDVSTHLVRNEPHATESARSVNAKVYTIGEDVVF